MESPADERLFEQAGLGLEVLAFGCGEVYLQYTSEYMKGPMYWHPDKLWLDCNFREPVVALNAEEPWEAEF